MKVEERFSKVAIQSLLWAIYYLTLFFLSRLQCKAENCVLSLNLGQN